MNKIDEKILSLETELKALKEERKKELEKPTNTYPYVGADDCGNLALFIAPRTGFGLLSTFHP